MQGIMGGLVSHGRLKGSFDMQIYNNKKILYAYDIFVFFCFIKKIFILHYKSHIELMNYQ